ncbi:hypothetical protein QCA50_004770 [Cerrena zonata]|uniref:Uncharacterized protein n=1 Tax=Cerrena zonata TaxID=2478898 RepID=A0AAW0GFI1_9APHY
MTSFLFSDSPVRRLYDWHLQCLEHLVTLFLFTKSDFKTLLLPVICFAIAASPHVDLSRVCLSILWTWLHLLQFTVSNQTLDVDEDAANKAYRPLPSGRISLMNARLLRWLLVPSCLTVSSYFDFTTTLASIAVIVSTLLHNELGLHARSWVIRNLLNGLGLASYELGATAVIAGSNHHLDDIALRGIVLSATVFMTTIHAQDFEDIEGDLKVGRRTLPIVYPRVARYSMTIGLFVWSLMVSSVWNLDLFASGMLTISSVFIGLRYIYFRDVESDKASYIWYNLWLSVTNLLPAYYRYIV